MLKNKINDIIYSDELTEEEKEAFCYYWGGDTYEYGTYGACWEFIDARNEQACYDARIEEMADDIISKGAIWTFNLALCEDSNKLNMAIIKYLRTLAKDKFLLKKLDNIINS